MMLGLAFYWDWTYVLVIIGALISMVASINVNSKFNKYSKLANSRGLTANDVAMTILQGAGINDVRIERIKGNLTDHYSPSEKVLRLSDSTYGQRSVAAIGVAAHEAGHAIQHQVGYGPLKLRSLAVPVANIGSKLSWPLVIIGLIIGNTDIAIVGVLLFSAVLAFQIITLPVEFNASNRAIEILDSSGVLVGNELSGAKSVLRAAALTYVASMFATLLQLLRLILLVRGRSND